MGMYAYQSMDATGKIVRGKIEAMNLPDLELRLKNMNLDLIDCHVQTANSILNNVGSVSRKDLIHFCFHLEQLTSSGVPLLEGLADLRDSIDNPKFRSIVADLMENIGGGAQLSEALMRYPSVFDRTFSALIKAGEKSGNLSEVLRNLSESIKWQDELAAQTKKIIMYPAFVGCVVLGVTFFLMIFLVPELIGFIKNMGGEIPVHTQVLMLVSDLFVHYWAFILAVPILTFAGLKFAITTSRTARFKFDQFKLRIWLVGPILNKIILSRFTTFFALLYASGITVLDSIELSEEIVGNAYVSDGLKRVSRLISDGQGLTAAFQTTGIFPPLVIRMLKIGESTGQLDTALRNVSYFYNREIKEMIERVQSMIEPMMTVFLGLILGWVMLSVLGPIYELISKIKT